MKEMNEEKDIKSIDIVEIMVEPKKKRKTKTSSAVVDRYKKKTYDKIGIWVKKELSEKYKTKCAAKGVPINKALLEAIEKFVNED